MDEKTKILGKYRYGKFGNYTRMSLNIPQDIYNDKSITTYRVLDKDDNVVEYYERNKTTQEWEDKTKEWHEWEKQAKEFIKQNGKLGAKKNRSASNNTKREYNNNVTDELYEAQMLLAKLLKEQGGEESK